MSTVLNNAVHWPHFYSVFSATYPLDLTKTRLQIQGEWAARQNNGAVVTPYRGMLQTAVGIGIHFISVCLIFCRRENIYYG